MKTVKIFALAALLALSAASARSAGKEIYPDPSQARADLEAALKAAPLAHKRILLDFGGNWCGDCQVLDLYFHDAKNLPILEANYLLVHVNIGHMDANTDIAAKYQIPLNRGVPALAVLSESGKLIYCQKSGEFEDMRHLESTSLTTFLVEWKPAKGGCSAVAVNC